MENDHIDKGLIYWLICIMIMVFAMVFIGGITRLTDSGLSMVDWKPLMGAIPPMNEEQWQNVFSQYKNSPEFLKVNFEMDIAGFKKIFFWEYFHRLFGRLIGLVFIIPFLYFYMKKRIQGPMRFKIFVAFILGGLQGLMGWYMVKSGLVNRPDVSQYRLCAHLLLAFFIIGYLYYLVLHIRFPRRKFKWDENSQKYLIFFLLLLILQISYGALVAGLDAGLTHNTFPKMGRHWFPQDAFIFQPVWINIFENPVLVQFIHRTIGWVLFFATGILWLKREALKSVTEKRLVGMIGIMIIVQFLLGVSTILMNVPLSLASMHQLGALILFMLCVKLCFYHFSAENN